jgi:hypothetical protein
MQLPQQILRPSPWFVIKTRGFVQSNITDAVPASTKDSKLGITLDSLATMARAPLRPSAEAEYSATAPGLLKYADGPIPLQHAAAIPASY